MSATLNITTSTIDCNTCVDEPLTTIYGSTVGNRMQRPRGSNQEFDFLPMLELFGPSYQCLCRCTTVAIISSIACISFGVAMKLTANQPTQVNAKTVSSFGGLLLGGCLVGFGLMSGVIAFYVRHHHHSRPSQRPLILEETTIRFER